MKDTYQERLAYRVTPLCAFLALAEGSRTVFCPAANTHYNRSFLHFFKGGYGDWILLKYCLMLCCVGMRSSAKSVTLSTWSFKQLSFFKQKYGLCMVLSYITAFSSAAFQADPFLVLIN